MNELRIDPSAVLRNSARGTSNACTFTPSAYSARSPASTFLSSTVTSTRSMSDLAHTVSCERLPQRTAARTERSSFTSAMSASSALVNLCSISAFPMFHRRGRQLSLPERMSAKLRDLALGFDDQWQQLAAFLADGGTSLAGLAAKKPFGLSVKPM